jgi:hypothetical protein
MFVAKDNNYKPIIEYDATDIYFLGFGNTEIKFKIASFQINKHVLQAACDIAHIYDLYRYSNYRKAEQFQEGSSEKSMFILEAKKNEDRLLELLSILRVAVAKPSKKIEKVLSNWIAFTSRKLMEEAPIILAQVRAGPQTRESPPSEEYNQVNRSITKAKFSFHYLKDALQEPKFDINEVRAISTEIKEKIKRYPEATFPEKIAIGRVEKLYVTIKADPTLSSSQFIELQDNGQDEIPVDIMVYENEFIKIIGEKQNEIKVPSEKKDSVPTIFYIEAIKIGEINIRLQFLQNGSYIGEIIVYTKIEDSATQDGRINPPSGYTIYTGKSYDSNHILPPPDLTIIVRKISQDGKYEMGILQKGYRVTNWLGYIYCNANSESDVDSLFSMMHGNKMLPMQITNRINDVGERLYDSYFKPLQNEYWKLKTTKGIESIQIITDEPYIPWEIVKPYIEQDGIKKSDGFLCQVHSIARWITTEVDRNDKDPIRNVVIALPNSGLKEVKNEYNWLKDFFAEYNITPEILSSVRALLNKFKGSDFDILHIAAHGSFTTQAGGSLPFTDGSIIPGDIPSGKLHNTRPMIFLNICSSARQVFKFNTISGWAQKFIKEGAAVFLGTLWPIDDVTARGFTEAFYENLREGKPVGLAVKNARQTCEHEGDTSHLAYVLYAHPETKIIFEK